MTRGFTRILVPTDFSAPSDAALAAAKDLATRFGASLHLVHTRGPVRRRGLFGRGGRLSPPGIKESWHREADKHLNALLTPAERSVQATTTVLFSGSAARRSSNTPRTTTSI